MKKIAIFLIIMSLLSLSACGDDIQTNNNNNDVTSNNTTSTNSNTSSVISDFDLPEREDPTSSSTSSNNSSNSNNSYDSSYDPDDTTSQLTVSKKLTLEVDKPNYTSSAITINLVLYSEGGVFNYYTDFFLQKYENGKWEYHKTINDIIDYKFNIASSQSNVEFVTYDLSKLYSTPLPTGTYRFIQESDNGKLVSNSFEIVDNIYSTEEQPQ